MIPRPTHYQPTGDATTLADGMVIAAGDPEAAGVAALLATEVEAATGWTVNRGGAGAESPHGTVRLATRPDDAAPRSSPEGRPESYRLEIKSTGVDITAPGPAGLFYGTRTLLQLMPPEMLRAAPAPTAPLTAGAPVRLEGCVVEDAPRFGWRGMALDVSRHFFPKGFILKLVDLAAFHKLNVLHLHLTDDQGWRIEVDRYPLLTEVGAWRRESPLGHYRDGRSDGRPHGGYYTKQDLAEIVAYAARRFVTVVPEIDMPGHMQAAIAAYPQLGNTGHQLEVYTHWGISDHVLNLGETTLQFCAEVLGEVMDVFPSPFVHIGGDECPTTEWSASPAARARCDELGLAGVGGLQGWFTARMAEVTGARGRSLVAWDEVLDAGAPPGSVISVWRADHASRAAAQAARDGHDVIMAPEPWAYFDWSYSDDPREPVAIRPAISVEKAYSFEPVPPRLADDLRHHVIGAQCQLWTEYVSTPEHAEYMYFPRACAFAEVAWSQGPRDWAEVQPRLAEHTKRLTALGVNYRPLDGPTPGQARTWLSPGLGG